LLYPLKNRHLQRLWWALNSPTLLAQPLVTHYFIDAEHRRQMREVLHALDADGESINSHFQKLGPMPMGRYFEQLFFFAIQHDSQYELLEENRQIFEGKITRGELDLVLRNHRSGGIEHCEIALKFYLQIKNNAQPQHMLGPSTRDNLGKKLEKLLGAQIPLSQIDEIQKDYPGIEPKLMVKGIFFYPWQQSWTLSAGVSAGHLQGAWLSLDALASVNDSSGKWLLRKKPDWIGGLQFMDDKNLLDISEIKTLCQEAFSEEKGPQFISRFRLMDGIWQEESYFFVCPNQWPENQ
jgi:hypothetical protein